MIKLLKNRHALSTVVTTLIILVISVLLASVVTYFAINIVSTRVQEESLHVTKQHLWLNATAPLGSTSAAQATLMVLNTGGRDVVIDKIAVRGQECDWNNSATNKFVLYATANSSVSGDMPYVQNFTIGYDFQVAPGDLVLKSGYTLLLYIVNPDSIAVNDVGLTVGIAVYSAQAVYYRETNVEAVAMQ